MASITKPVSITGCSPACHRQGEIPGFTAAGADFFELTVNDLGTIIWRDGNFSQRGAAPDDKTQMKSKEWDLHKKTSFNQMNPKEAWMWPWKFGEPP